MVSIGEVSGRIGLDIGPFDGALDRATRNLQGWGSRTARVAAGVGVAVGAVIGASIVSGMDMERARDKMNAQLGLVGKDAEKASRAAGIAFKNGWGANMDEAAAATGAVISSIRGMREASDQEIAKMAGKVSAISETFDLEAGRVSEVVGRMVSEGLVKNADQGLDQLTRSLQKVPASVRDELIDAMDEYGPHFAQLGISGDKAFAMLVASAEKGRYGIDKTGDALKELGIRAADGSKASVDALKAMGLNADQIATDIAAGGDKAAEATEKIVTGLLGIKDPAKQSQAAIALMGTPIEDLSQKDIPEFLKQLGGMTTGLGDVDGATDEMSKTLQDNAMANLKRFARQIQMFAVDVIGGYFIPFLNKLTEPLTDLGKLLKDVGGWIRKNEGWLAPLVTLLGTAAAGFYALNLAMKAHAAWQAIVAAGGMLQFIKGVITSTKAWTAAQAALNFVMSANPIGIVIIAIAALVAAFVVAYKKSETFRKVVDGALRWILDTGKAVGAWFAGPFADFFKRMGQAISADWERLKSDLGRVRDWFLSIGAAISADWERLKSDLGRLGAWFAGVWNGIVGAVRSAAGWIVSVTASMMAGVLGVWNKLVSGVQGWLAKVLLFQINTWNAAKDGAIRIVTWMWNSLMQGFRNAYNNLTRWGSTLLGWGQTLWTKLKTTAVTLTSQLAVGVINAVRGIPDSMARIFNLIPDKLKAPIRNAVKWVNDTFIGGLNNLLSKVGISEKTFRVPRIPGFSAGGYTGKMDPARVAGFVHGDEQVIKSPSRRSIEQRAPGFLDALNQHGGKALDAYGFAGGGRVHAKPWPTYVATLIRRLFNFNGTIGGYGKRARQSDHTTGNALDIMVNKDRGMGDRISAWALKNFHPLMLKYVIWWQRINSGDGWRGMSSRGSFTADHKDHPHLSFQHDKWGRPELLGKQLSPEETARIMAGGGGGGGLDMSWLTSGLDKILSGFKPQSMWGNVVLESTKKIPGALVDKVMQFMPSFLGGHSGDGINGAGAGVERWRGLVNQALSFVGQPATPYLENVTLRRMNQESGGNPRAINKWDINAIRGTPSKGLMQVIDPTFRANARAPYNKDIWDPMSNVTASMFYALRRYGSLPAAYNRKGGYFAGTDNATRGMHWVGEKGPELVMTPQQRLFGGGESVTPTGKLRAEIDPQEFRNALEGVKVDLTNGRLVWRSEMESWTREENRRNRQKVGVTRG